jgi:hypothetical protein
MTQLSSFIMHIKNDLQPFGTKSTLLGKTISLVMVERTLCEKQLSCDEVGTLVKF